MKTLFLGFDGVLHPLLPRHDQRFGLAPMLAMALHGFDCEVVISSSWRSRLTQPEILLLLPKPLASRVVGFTGRAITGRLGRYREILAWLEQHGPRDWRALDHSAYDFPTPCAGLFCCAGERGITERELDQLKAWLASSSDPACARPQRP